MRDLGDLGAPGTDFLFPSEIAGYYAGTRNISTKRVVQPPDLTMAPKATPARLLAEQVDDKSARG